MLTVTLLLVLAAFLVTLASAYSPPKAPLWIAVLLLVVVELLRLVPIR